MTPTKTTRYQLLTEDLLNKIEGLSRDEQAVWLFLSVSEEFKGRWQVEALYPDFFFDFEGVIGHYRTVSPAKLEEFLKLAADGGYQVVFEDPPEGILEEYEHLRDPPPFSLNSSLENTVNGFLPWQIEGFNKLVRDESLKAGLGIWDTGTGKTAFIAAALKWHKEWGHKYDLGLVVVKKNNKTDMQRKLKTLAGLDSLIIEGKPEKRDAIYDAITTELVEKRPVIAITNYEKFRDDEALFKFLVEDRNCLFFWDEMPTRLSNRTTQVYDAIQKILWVTFQTSNPQMRPEWMRQWELTATPIENAPDGLFNCVRLMDPLLLGSVTQFEKAHVIHRNPESHKPDAWTRLDKLEGQIEHMTHRVSAQDPEVAKMFPEIMEDLLIIDWDIRDRAVYDMLASNAVKILEEESESEEFNVLALIQIMQMLCDAPSMIGQSAQNRKEFDKLISNLGEDDELPRLDGPKGSEIALRLVESLKRTPTDTHHTKFETLHEILTEKHPNEKVLVYMTWASYGFPPLMEKLDEWGISYVTYAGTDRQRQAAKDRFRTDPSIRVFLSSDKGSDSIDLPEAAVGVNYNLPWTWTRKRQRQGRNNRVDSQLETTWWYDLIMADSVEERKREIIDTKHGYHKALFDGKAVEDTMSSKLTREDLIYILKG